MFRKVFFISLTLSFAIMAFQIPEQSTSVSVTKSEKKKKKEKKEEVNNDTLIWHNMTEGLALAQKEKKILIVDVYTDWCGYCKLMDRNTYTNLNLIRKINQYAVAVKFNPEKNDTFNVKGRTMNQNQLVNFLSKGGRIYGYPTTFFWKNFADEKSIVPYAGYLDTTQLNTIINNTVNQQ